MTTLLSNTAIAATLNTLERLRLDKELLHKVLDIVTKERRTVTLSLEEVEYMCVLIGEKTIVIDSPSEHITENSSRSRLRRNYRSKTKMEESPSIILLRYSATLPLSRWYLEHRVLW